MKSIGRLDRFMTVRRRMQDAPDSEFDFASAWSSLVQIAGGESEAAGQRYASQIIVFKCRFFDVQGILATDTIVCDGVTYDIKSTRELGWRDALEIVAQATI